MSNNLSADVSQCRHQPMLHSPTLGNGNLILYVSVDTVSVFYLHRIKHGIKL